MVVVLDSKEIASERGLVTAAEAVLTQFLGKGLKGSKALTRKTVLEMEVEDSVDITRLQNTDLFKSLYPSVVAVEFIDITPPQKEST